MNARMRKLFMLECNCCCCCCCCCWCCFHRDDLVSTAPRYISRKWVERCQTTETQELSPDFSTRPPIPDLCAEMISPPCASPSGLTSQAFQHLWTIPKKEGIVPIHRDNTTYLHTDSHTHTHTRTHTNTELILCMTNTTYFCIISRPTAGDGTQINSKVMTYIQRHSAFNCSNDAVIRLGSAVFAENLPRIASVSPSAQMADSDSADSASNALSNFPFRFVFIISLFLSACPSRCGCQDKYWKPSFFLFLILKYSSLFEGKLFGLGTSRLTSKLIQCGRESIKIKWPTLLRVGNDHLLCFPSLSLSFSLSFSLSHSISFVIFYSCSAHIGGRNRNYWPHSVRSAVGGGRVPRIGVGGATRCYATHVHATFTAADMLSELSEPLNYHQLVICCVN